MMNKLRNWLRKPVTIIPLVIVCCLVSMAVGRVNGLFNNVDALGGYTLNGTAGTAGYALCTSTGAKFDTACSLAGVVLYYQHIISVTSTEPQEAFLRFASSSDFTVTDNGGGDSTDINLANTGTAGTYAYPTSVTTDSKGRVTSITGGSAPNLGTALTAGTNGYYEILSNGTIVDHVNLTSLPNDNTYHAYTLPHSFASFVASTVCSIDRPGGNPGPVGVQSGGLSNINLLSNTGGSGTLMNASCVVTGE